MAKWFYRVPLLLGFVLVVLSTALYLALYQSAVAEQALSPGEKSLGVAVLGMLYGPPIVGSAVAGVVALLVGMSALAFQRMRTPE